MNHSEICRNIQLLRLNDNEFGISIKNTPICINERENEHFLVQLGVCQIPLKKILTDLNLIDQIKLASTSKQIREAVKLNSLSLRNIEQISSFNLDLFPNVGITKHEIDIIFRVFENMRKLKVDLSIADNGFLDNIGKFKKLQKISIYLEPNTRNLNKHFLYLQSITIKARFNHSDIDSIYFLLSHIHGIKTLSFYRGDISVKTTTLLETRKLQKLKIHNTTIKNCYYFIKYLLELRSLEHLKITSDSFLAYPHPIYIMSDIITQLDKHELNLTFLAFTVDTSCKIKYENLKYLKNLRHMEVHYSVQDQTINIERIINTATSMKHVKTTFIEFFDTNRIFNKSMFDACERRSYCIQSIISSSETYMEIRSINYDELRLEAELAYLD